MPARIMDAGFYLRNPMGKTRLVDDGKGGQRRERLPSSAGRKRHRAILGTDGHVVLQPLTSHSANLDMECSQAQFYRKKARRLGWIPTGHCPVVLVMGGQLDRIHLCDELLKEIQKGNACQPQDCSEDSPCKHVLMEEKSRKAKRLADETKRAAAHESLEAKQIQAQRDTQASISKAMDKMTQVLEKSTDAAK